MTRSGLARDHQKMKALALVLSIALGASCATVASALPAVVAAVTDGMMVIDTIERFVHAYFVAHPSAETQAAVDAAIEKTRIALNVALRTAQGAKDLDQAKVDEAFANFKTAYVELIALVTPLGVLPGGDTMMARPHTLVVPDPVALTLKVR